MQGVDGVAQLPREVQEQLDGDGALLGQAVVQHGRQRDTLAPLLEDVHLTVVFHQIPDPSEAVAADALQLGDARPQRLAGARHLQAAHDLAGEHPARGRLVQHGDVGCDALVGVFPPDRREHATLLREVHGLLRPRCGRHDTAGGARGQP
ncbi:MAG: hypothetical protein R3F59_38620 [Myxococcota bacterium]